MINDKSSHIYNKSCMVYLIRNLMWKKYVICDKHKK